MTARQKFLALLKEDILQVGLSELDFGLYRILNHKRTEIEAFLEEELPAEIGRVLRALPGTPSEDEEARLYNALYTFFSRYFVDADFMPRARRGRDAAYSVPYDGADTVFHWASKGSHYVKSGERFAAYVYTQKDGARVRFAVVAADTQKDNAKGEKRYYLPAACHEEAVGGLSQFRVEFAWRPLAPEEARRYAKGRAKAEEDTADEGGEAQEGRGPQAKLLNAWLSGADFKSVIPPAGLERESLERQLHRYVHGQDSDFFVHPRLAAFLTGELDYFLKNEFMNVWDLPDGQALLREREKLKAVRTLASAIIRLLAAIEDVQAILFEKRKFVLSAHYLAQCSWLLRQGGEAGRALVAEAVDEPKQVAEWRNWVNDATADGPTLLARYPHLPLNTAHFGEDFKWRLLASFPDIAAATGGVLIHGDNYAALRTLEPSYREAVKCIYIDPPYNTGSDGFPYKDASLHSSWLSFISGRVTAGMKVLSADGAMYISLDDNESHRARLVFDDLFGEGARLATFVRRRRMASGMKEDPISPDHEYILAYGKEGRRPALRGFGMDEEDYPLVDSISCYRSTDLTIGMGRNLRPNQYYPIINPKTGNEYWPSESRVWRFEPGTMAKEIAAKNIIWPDDEPAKRMERPRYKTRYLPGKAAETWRPISTWLVREAEKKNGLRLGYGAGLNQEATRELGNFFENPPQIYPKPASLIEDLLFVSDTAAKTCLDFFAGSGTTGHAVINLNREDGGARKFILVEQGEYFHSVLLPRIAKVMACPDWKEGKPKDGVSFESGDDEGHWSRRTLPLVQVLALERYEDSLDALELPAERQARQAGQAAFPQLERSLRYLHDASAQGSTVRLATEKLARPFDYRLPLTHEGRYAEAPVDLVHTGFLLAGLHPLRLRRMEREGRPVVLAEARPQGAAHQTVLVLWREVDDSRAPELLLAAAQAEYAWLNDTVTAAFGRELTDYAVIWHNRDLMLLGGETGRSLDAVLAEKMWERA